MKQYLALKLQGVMQAWGGHTYEDLRHTELMPTRSGVLGLLAGCLGIDRKDTVALQNLAAGTIITVRVDDFGRLKGKPQRIMDFHTVLDARKVNGKAGEYPVVSRREYWCDTSYTVLLEIRNQADYSLDDMEVAVKQPVYTPFLGRRSCPLSRPLFEERLEAIDARQALALVEPCRGTLYSESDAVNGTALRVRDVPLYARKRQFATRTVYVSQQMAAEDSSCT